MKSGGMMKRRHSHLRTCSLAHTCVSARGEATCRERERGYGARTQCMHEPEKGLQE